MIVDVIRIVETALMRYPSDPAEPAGRVCGAHSLPRLGAEDAASLPGIAGDEIQQAGYRSQVVVDSPDRNGSSQVAGVGLAGDTVGGHGGPPRECLRLLDRGRGVTQDVSRVVEASG